MSFDKDTKVLNSVFILPETHYWLLMQANKAGMDLRYFAGMLLDRARTEYIAGTNSENDAVAVLDLLQGVKAQKAMIEDDYRIASIYLEHLDDTGMAEKLGRLRPECFQNKTSE